MDSSQENELWILCPICYTPNPAGTPHCKNCWRAIIHPGSPLSYEEAQEISNRRASSLRRRKTIKTIAISITSLVILAAAIYSGLYYFTDTVFKPPQDVNSDSLPGEWAMFRHDLGHSGTTDPASNVPKGTLKWSFSTDGPIHSSPAVANDTVYIGSRDFKLYALDADTGAKRWEYKTGTWVESSPAIVNGVVYFGSNDSKLYALDMHSGEKIWDFKTAYPVRSSPAIANGIVYFGSDDYHLYALDAAEGEKLWSYNTRSPAISSPVISKGIVYTGSGSGFCYAFNALNGQRRLRFKSHYPVYSSPAVSDETVYFITDNGYLIAVDGKSRTWLQEHEIRPFWLQAWAMGIPGVPPPPPQSGLLWSLRISSTATSSPVIAGDTLYVGSDNKLLAIDLQSKQTRWEFKTKGAIRSSPAVAGSAIFVGSEDGRLYAVDAATGEKLWDFLTGDRITSSPTVANGIVYIASHDGNLYALE